MAITGAIRVCANRSHQKFQVHCQDHCPLHYGVCRLLFVRIRLQSCHQFLWDSINFKYEKNRNYFVKLKLINHLIWVRIYVPQFLCSPVLCSPASMFPSTCKSNTLNQRSAWCFAGLAQRTRDISRRLGKCWFIVFDAGPTFTQSLVFAGLPLPFLDT